MRVQVTLTGDCNGVCVSEKTATGFTVAELRGGASNAIFDWEVAAKRKGYEASGWRKRATRPATCPAPTVWSPPWARSRAARVWRSATRPRPP